MHQVIAQEFDDCMFSVQDFVLFHAFINDDCLLGLQSGVAGIHNEMLLAGLVAGGRRKLHDLIQAGPKLLCRNGSLLACGFQGRYDNIAFFMDGVSLPILDIRACQHLEHGPGQHAVAPRRGSISRIAGIFILVTLKQLQFDLNRLVGGSQIGDLIGMYRTG